MRYRNFGRTGLRVSEYVLGTANFGSASSAAGEEGARAIFETFVAAGGTTFDVSNIYQSGEAEQMLGDLLGRDRDDYVVITKYSGSRSPDVRPGTTGNSRKTMIRSLEDSLGRLKTDYVDVFMPHFPDGVTPVDEILAGFEDLRRSGKIRYGGFSNFPAWRVAGAAVRSQLNQGSHGLVAGVQTEYSLVERSAERELIPMAQAHGLGVVAYSPLAGGLLTGKYRRGDRGRLGTRATEADSGQRAGVLDTVLTIAEELDTGPVHIALAWLRDRAAQSATSMVPIVGPRTTTHLQGYLEALEVMLDPDHLRRLNEVSAIPPGAPHADVAAALAHGVDGDRELLDSPYAPII